ncbi:hypothetical protein EDB80DRAFT_685272 [Ilyonectria destructans]|nr:hypothetical protein EDB80DRAFT_685272 [Ilyonectria destructans]
MGSRRRGEGRKRRRRQKRPGGERLVGKACLRGQKTASERETERPRNRDRVGGQRSEEAECERGESGRGRSKVSLVRRWWLGGLGSGEPSRQPSGCARDDGASRTRGQEDKRASVQGTEATMTLGALAGADSSAPTKTRDARQRSRRQADDSTQLGVSCAPSDWCAGAAPRQASSGSQGTGPLPLYSLVEPVEQDKEAILRGPSGGVASLGASLRFSSSGCYR